MNKFLVTDEKVVLKNHRLKLKITLDASEIFPNDPGMGTPAMVELHGWDATGTYNCVTSESEIDGVGLSEVQLEWLNSFSEDIDRWLTYHTQRLTNS